MFHVINQFAIMPKRRITIEFIASLTTCWRFESNVIAIRREFHWLLGWIDESFVLLTAMLRLFDGIQSLGAGFCQLTFPIDFLAGNQLNLISSLRTVGFVWRTADLCSIYCCLREIDDSLHPLHFIIASYLLNFPIVLSRSLAVIHGNSRTAKMGKKFLQ